MNFPEETHEICFSFENSVYLVRMVNLSFACCETTEF